jgi:hypothetical protein
MAITTEQKVDYLFKKIGYGVAKTDTSTVKSPSNESVGSPLLIRGDSIWAQSDLIPEVKPSSSTDVVTVYSDDTTNSVESINDSTASTNRTWKTNLSNWIPPEFGSSYQVKVFLATAGATTPETTGTQLFSDGTGNNDEWYFDYASGILNFIGTNLPSVSFSGKSIFIVGARYTGNFGISTIANITIGDITIDGNNISSTSNIILSPADGIINANNSTITNLVDPVNDQDAATKSYVDDYIASFNDDKIVLNNTVVQAFDTNVTIISNSSLQAYFTETTSVLSNVSITNTSISGLGQDIMFSGNSGVIVPVGAESNRPLAPTAGYLRFNSDSSTIEYYNGQNWISVTSVVKSQIITGNNIDDTFELDYPTDANGIIVSINGTLQQPASAYTVQQAAGVYSITFSEVPNDLDIIEVRYISSSTVPSVNSTVVNTGNVDITSSDIIIDSFSETIYQSAKYTISLTNAQDRQLVDILLVHNNGTSFINIINNVNTGSNVATFTSNVNSTQVNLIATGATSSGQLRIQKTYFIL